MQKVIQGCALYLTTGKMNLHTQWFSQDILWSNFLAPCTYHSMSVYQFWIITWSQHQLQRPVLHWAHLTIAHFIHITCGKSILERRRRAGFQLLHPLQPEHTNPTPHQHQHLPYASKDNTPCLWDQGTRYGVNMSEIFVRVWLTNK